MLTLGIETIVVLLLIMGVACALGGYAYAQARQRKAGGGKTAEELKSELNDYKGNVTEHFQTTANLLHGMTEQYRAVYQHMATGAQDLCDSTSANPQIESLRAGLLPAADIVESVPDETSSVATLEPEADATLETPEALVDSDEIPGPESANSDEGLTETVDPDDIPDEDLAESPVETRPVAAADESADEKQTASQIG